MTDVISWTGDLDDDCVARWRGLMLRAERMGSRDWWWAVYGPGDREEFCWDHDGLADGGNAARAAAEAAARKIVAATPCPTCGGIGECKPGYFCWQG